MTVVLQDWPTQTLEVLFALNLYDREVKKWIPKSRIVKRFAKERGKSWDTWVEIGNKIGMAQGHWDHSKYRPLQINIVHSNKDSEDKDSDEDYTVCQKLPDCSINARIVGKSDQISGQDQQSGYRHIRGKPFPDFNNPVFFLADRIVLHLNYATMYKILILFPPPLPSGIRSFDFPKTSLFALNKKSHVTPF
jgi:hypothetical protein